ncbi:MAG: histidine phosphatase family protein [Thiolinea sp.]
MFAFHNTRYLLLIAGLLLYPVFSSLYAAANDQRAVWQALRSGDGIAMIRHALAPGTGDPANFDVNDCSTQRNLSDEGREQAQGIGKLFKGSGMSEVRLFSSQWCRCLETAELMVLGAVTKQPLLNSFFRNREEGNKQTADLQQWLSQQEKVADQPLVLVTHQVNITGLTGIFPSSGEIVVIRHPAAADTAIEVIGTIETD